MRGDVIHIHPLAPAKPPQGAACNGCGVCCLSQPCPVGSLVSRRLHSACSALLWDELSGRYRCKLVDPQRRLLARLARRWIAAGQGCDSSAEVQPLQDADAAAATSTSLP
jgi:hypothetical protein